MTTWEQSYEGQLRRHVGSRKLLMPGARAFIQDGDGRTLFIKRRDNGRWGLPAGGKELDETLYETLEREVKEETGLDVVSATLIAVYSGSRFSGRNMFGNDYEHLVFQFRVDEWSGSLVRETDESTDAGFFHAQELPEPYEYYREAFADLQSFSGKPILK